MSSIIAVPAEWGVYVDADIGPAGLPQNNLEGKDYARYLPTAVERLTSAPAAGVAIPADARYAIVTVVGGSVNIRTSADTDASATEGFTLAAGSVFQPPGRAFMLAMSFIEVDAGDPADVRVLYGY